MERVTHTPKEGGVGRRERRRKNKGEIEGGERVRQR